jgi:hypothetical protein
MPLATIPFARFSSFLYARLSLPPLAALLVLLAGWVALAPAASLAQTVPYTESFETDGEGTRYQSNSFDGGSNAYFRRVALSDVGTTIDVSNPDGYTGITGSSFWATEYTNGPNGTGSSVRVVRLQELDVSGAGLVRFTGDFAIGCASPCFDGIFQDGEDTFYVEYSEDGGSTWTRALDFRGTSQGVDVNVAPDFDGDGVGEGLPLTNEMQPYGFVLPATASLITIRVYIELDENEEIAFDNFRLEEIPPVGVPFAEDFEVDGNGTTYFPSRTFDDGDVPSSGYFKRTNGSDIIVENGAYAGFSGSFFWAGADLDGSNSFDFEDLKSLTLPEIDVTGEDAVRFTGLFGAGKYDPMDDESFNSYDLNDSLVVRYSTDGGATFQRGLKFSYDPGTSGSSFSRPIGLDTNFDGVADGPTLVPTMQPFSFDLPSSASTVIIRLDMYLQNGNEQLAYDNLRVEAVEPNPIQLVDPIADQSIRQFRTDAIQRAEDVFDEINGAPLTLSVSSSNPTVLRADLVNFGQWIEIEGLQLGSSVVTVTAQNSNGDTNSTQFNVSVTTPGPVLEVDVRIAPAAEVCSDPANLSTCSDVPETGDGFGGFRRDTLVVDPGAPVAITYFVENTGTLDVTRLDIADDNVGALVSGGPLLAGATEISTRLLDTSSQPANEQSAMRVTAEATDGVQISRYDVYRIDTPAPDVTIDVLLEEAQIACTDPADPATCADLSTDASTPTGKRRDTVDVAVGQPVLVEYVVTNTGQTTLTTTVIERYTNSGSPTLVETIPVDVPSLAPGDSTRTKRIEAAPSTIARFLDPFRAIAISEDGAGNTTAGITDPGRKIDVFGIRTSRPSVDLNALIGIAADFCTDDTDLSTCSDLPRTGPTPTGERRDTVDVTGGDRLLTQFVLTNTGRTRITSVEIVDRGDTGIPSPIVPSETVDLAPGDSIVYDRLYDLPAAGGDSFIRPVATGADAAGTEPEFPAQDLLGIFAADATIDINSLVGIAAEFCTDVTTVGSCSSIPRTGTRPSDGGRVDTISTAPLTPILVEYVVTNNSTATVDELTVEDDGQVVISETSLGLAPGAEFVTQIIFDAPSEVQSRVYTYPVRGRAVDANGASLNDYTVHGLRLPPPIVFLDALIAPADEFCTDLADIRTCSDIPATGDGFGNTRRDTVDIYAGEPVYAQYRITNGGETELVSVRVEDPDGTVRVAQTGVSLLPGEEIVLEERFDGAVEASDVQLTRPFARGEDAGGNVSGSFSDGTRSEQDPIGVNVKRPVVTLNALVGPASEFCTNVTDVSICSDIPTGGSTPTGARRDTVDALPGGAPYLVRYLVENTGDVDVVALEVVERLNNFGSSFTTVIPVGSIPPLAPGDSYSEQRLFGSATTPGIEIYRSEARGEDPAGNALDSDRSVKDVFGIQTEGPAFRTTTLSGPASVFCSNVNDPSTCSLERQKRAQFDPAAKLGNDAQAVRYAFYNDGTVDFVQHSLLDDVTGVVFTDRMETVAPLDSLVIFRIGDDVAGIGESRTATWTAATSGGDVLSESSDEAPLPVELVRFVSQVSGRNVVLEWQTASEESNAGFAVLQRSVLADAEVDEEADWTRIGFVEGAGTTAEVKSYRFDIGAMTPGEYRFRLRQIDVDGRSALSKTVTALVGIDGPYRLTPPSPHPIRSASTLSLITKESQPVRVELFDLLGRRVAMLLDGDLTGGREQEIRVDGDGLANGVYFIRVVGEHFRATERITVIR